MVEVFVFVQIIKEPDDDGYEEVWYKKYYYWGPRICDFQPTQQREAVWVGWKSQI